MEKAFLILLLSLCSNLLPAQTIHINEPKFDGSIIYANDTVGDGIPLEKLVSQIKSPTLLKTMASGGKVISYAFVKNCCSSVRIAQRTKLSFLVPYIDRADPVEYLKIFKMTSEKKTRAVKIGQAKMKVFGEPDVEVVDSDYLKFTYQKYGERSYLVTIDALEPGEYAMAVNTQKLGMFYCFGVD
jgi:hypothetical protein